MNILLAAIIFTFFAVFAPSSHGDRPLLHAAQSNGEIQYLNFKLPIARLQAAGLVTRIAVSVLPAPFFIFFEPVSTQTLVSFLKQDFILIKKILTFPNSPLTFCEVLQI